MKELLLQKLTKQNVEESSLLSTDAQLSVDCIKSTLLTFAEGLHWVIYGHYIGWLLYEYEDNSVFSWCQIGARIGVTEQIIL